jgi:putative nucleotidyltransferase with HDIG domain
MAYAINVEQIKKAARNSIPLSIKTFTLPHETENYIEEVLGLFLDEFGQASLKDRLSYCMKELATNAKKANTKRVYFQEKELNITNLKDYKIGMETFKQETLDNIDYYLAKQKEAGLYVKVVFHAKGRSFSISVHNNTAISQKEQMRVYDRIARSRAFDSMEEALTSVLDDSEGAGLGIVILVLMLKKIGLNEDAFDIDIENDETVARITIPFSEIHIENMEDLSREVVSEINALPQFPENIVYIQKLISDPTSEITDIAREISLDPSLTGDLLKVVNSAAYMLPKKVDNIVEAVKLLGLRGLRNLLYSYGTQKLLSDQQKWLQDHSRRAAFYAYNLAKNFKRKQRNLLDDAYVGGILHDMGKIIFQSVHPNLLDKINKFCNTRDIKRNMMEDLSAGLDHSEIGAKIAEKWNFPDTLIAAIRYHHFPTDAPEAFQDVVYTVYLANAICDFERKILGFEQIDRNVLFFFGIKTEEQFNSIQTRLNEAFTRELERI